MRKNLVEQNDSPYVNNLNSTHSHSSIHENSVDVRNDEEDELHDKEIESEAEETAASDLEPSIKKNLENNTLDLNANFSINTTHTTKIEIKHNAPGKIFIFHYVSQNRFMNSENTF